MGEKEKVCSDIMNYVRLQRRILCEEFEKHRYNPIERYDILGQNKALQGLQTYLKLYCAEVGQEVQL